MWGQCWELDNLEGSEGLNDGRRSLHEPQKVPKVPEAQVSCKQGQQSVLGAQSLTTSATFIKICP